MACARRTRRKLGHIGFAVCAVILCAWSFGVWQPVEFNGRFWSIWVREGGVSFALEEWRGPPALLASQETPSDRRGLHLLSSGCVDSVPVGLGLVLPAFWTRSDPIYVSPLGGASGLCRVDRTYASVPFWPLLLFVATLTGVARWYGRPFPMGHCQNCGYDLTGNVSGRCSECGVVADVTTTARESPMHRGRRVRGFLRCWGLLVVMALPGAMYLYVTTFPRVPSTVLDYVVGFVVGSFLLAPFTAIVAAAVTAVLATWYKKPVV